jgi:hypothetical protein
LRRGAERVRLLRDDRSVFPISKFDLCTLLLTPGIFTGAYPLIVFRPGIVPLDAASIGSVAVERRPYLSVDAKMKTGAYPFGPSATPLFCP